MQYVFNQDPVKTEETGYFRYDDGKTYQILIAYYEVPGSEGMALVPQLEEHVLTIDFCPAIKSAGVLMEHSKTVFKHVVKDK